MATFQTAVAASPPLPVRIRLMRIHASILDEWSSRLLPVDCCFCYHCCCHDTPPTVKLAPQLPRVEPFLGMRQTHWYMLFLLLPTVIPRRYCCRRYHPPCIHIDVAIRIPNRSFGPRLAALRCVSFSRYVFTRSVTVPTPRIKCCRQRRCS
jgi:hypothetical protein